MNIALIGYGKMGKTIEEIATKRGHKISSIIDINNPGEWEMVRFVESDVAIEFTTPQTAVENIYRCFERQIPVVSGTTGWLKDMETVKKRCLSGNHTLFYASNFSIGVNILFAVNKYLAKIMNNFPAYEIDIEEIHHIHKKDIPSGTAITLAEGLIENLDHIKGWTLEENETEEMSTEVHIKALRMDEVPGAHEVAYESYVDVIRVSHEAKNREGFALGAVLAAEFAAKRTGFLEMKDMLSL